MAVQIEPEYAPYHRLYLALVDIGVQVDVAALTQHLGNYQHRQAKLPGATNSLNIRPAH
jgi:hypothetical protein